MLSLKVVFLFFCIPDVALAQKKQARTQDDSPKSQELELAQKFLDDNRLDSASYYFNIEKKQLGNKKWSLDFTNYSIALTRAYYIMGMSDSVVKYANWLIDNYHKHKAEVALVASYEFLALTDMYTGNFEEAEVFFNRLDSSLQFVDTSRISKERYYSLVMKQIQGMGVFYALQGRFQEGLIQFLKADSILKDSENMESQLNNKVYIANIYSELKQFQKAIEIYEAIEKAYIEGHPVDMIQVYDNVSLCYTELGNYEQANNNLKKSLQLARSEGDSNAVAFNFLTQNVNLRSQGLYEGALQKLNYAIFLFEFTKNHMMFHAARLDWIVLKKESKQLQKADVAVMDDVVAYFETSQAKEKYVHALRNQAEVHAFFGNYKKAAQVYKLHDSINAHHVEKKYSELTADIETKYRTNKFKDEAESQRQAREISELNNRKKSLILYFSISLAILSLLALWIFYRLFIKLKKSRNEIDIQNKILAKREEEKSLLLKELHHRVKNNLQIVSSLLYLQSIAAKDHSAKNAFKEGQNRVDAMAMIHKYLYTSEELTQVNIHKYLSRLVESIAYSYSFTPKNIDLKFNIAQEPLDVDIAIPLGLIANELVSNAFKHAFVEVERPKLSINLRMDGNLVLEVADNGAGVPKDVNYENTFGMELIQSLEKQLGAKLEYHFQKGALFRLIVPKEKLRKLP